MNNKAAEGFFYNYSYNNVKCFFCFSKEENIVKIMNYL